MIKQTLANRHAPKTITLHDDQFGVTSIEIGDSKIVACAKEFLQAAFAILFLAGLVYWAYDLYTRDIYSLPVLTNLDPEDPLAIKVSQEKAERAADRIAALGIEPAQRPESIPDEIQQPDPISSMEDAADEVMVQEATSEITDAEPDTTETQAPAAAGTGPQPVLRKLSSIDKAIMSALIVPEEDAMETGSDIAPKISLRPMPRKGSRSED